MNLTDRHHLLLQRANKWVQAAERGEVLPSVARDALGAIERQLGTKPTIAPLLEQISEPPAAA